MSPSQKRMSIDQKSIFDALYCDDEKWGAIEEDDTEEESEITLNKNDFNCTNLLPFEKDSTWYDEELQSLFLKEKETCFTPNNIIKKRFSCSLGRKEAIEWILKINAHFGFSALTAILAVNYLDRFLSTLSLEKDKQQPWMTQLAAVTCLSLAAKVEETHVPPLVELQVGGGTEHVFEAKNIQRMELLVLSALKWRMNPVTPISFIDHIMRRFRFKSFIHCEFLQSCENLLLSVLSDSRFVRYPPSVWATATMLHVIHQYNAIDYENQILIILKISKEEVDDCYEFISGNISGNGLHPKNINLKRKLSQIQIFTCDSSNDSWSVMDSRISASSPHQPIYKKSRVQEQKMKLPSLSRVFVDAVASPRH